MRLLLLSLSMLLAAGAGAASHSSVKFAPTSRLAEGRWVKVGIDRSGVYEVTHATLRAMGFNDPEKVGVYGRGGKQLEMNFVDATGNPLYHDELASIRVIHHDGKMYFYGIGPQEFTINLTSTAVPGWYERTHRNIYTDTGYYFLSDAMPLEEMPVADAPAAPRSAQEISVCYGMVNHEVDLLQNNTDTGQVFYGETIDPQNPRMEWQLKLPGAIPGGAGIMECEFYFDKDADCSWGYGVIDQEEEPRFIGRKVNTSALRTLAPAMHNVTVPGDEATLFVCMESEAEQPAVSNLDYWTLTYPRTLPTLTGTSGERLNQEEIAVPQAVTAGGGTLRFPGGAAFMAIDITTPEAPARLELEADGDDGIATLGLPRNVPRIVLFDPTMPQLQIKGFQTGYSQIVNQDLHRQAAEGADMVIICIPQLIDSARRLARLHEDYDGSTTLIATTEECYNEFSSGVPDPMAYRALVKATRASSRPCRNVLLLGPLYGDFRGVVSQKHVDEGIIAYQSTTITQSRGAQNANDILGMMADYIDLRDLHINDMEVGVGLLPVRYEAEAEIILDKIERYMEGEDIEFYLNAFTQIGGIGDNHAHDTQAIQLSNLVDRLSDYATVNSNLPVDAYGEQGAQDKLFNDFNDGRLFVNYFGHGAGTQLNQTGRFFTAADIYRLRNTRLPFMAFAGCSLTNTDRGMRGMGESIVLSTPYGAIGTLLATRETWSGENALFFDTFYINLFRDGSSAMSPAHKRALTIGEVFARAKTQTSNNNELAYQLICDPALVLPVTTRRVNFTEKTPKFTVGERISVTGYVAKETGTGEIDPTFNGKAVARLMAPVVTYVSADLCTGGPDKLRVPLTDRQWYVATADVVNGEFTVEFVVPAEGLEHINEPSRLHVAVYSPDFHTAGGGLLTGTLTRGGTLSPVEKDTQPPAIEHFDFDPTTMELHLRVTDNVALGYSNDPLNPSFRLSVDGKENPMGIHSATLPDVEGVAYEKSVPLADLTEGTHKAKVTVADAAGNRSSSEITFTYKTSAPSMVIRLYGTAVGSEARILPETPIQGVTEIVIIDSRGETVRREPFQAEGFIWDVCDAYGERVAPGLYKAYLIQTDGITRKAHSAMIDLPVVGQ